MPLLIDVLDDDPDRHARLSWRQAITHLWRFGQASFERYELSAWSPVSLENA